MERLLVRLREFVKWLMNVTIKNRWLVFLVDLLFCMSCFCLEVYLYDRYMNWNINPGESVMIGGCYFVLLVIVFLGFHTYRGLTRHLQFKEISRLGLAVALPSLALYAGLRFFDFPLNLPGLFTFNLFVFSLLALFFIRSFTIYLYTYAITYSGKKRKQTLIFGIEAHSVALSSWITRGGSSDSYQVLGFVTTEAGVGKMRIQGLSVYNIAKKGCYDHVIKEAEVLLFPDYKIARKNQELISCCLKKGLEVLVSPPIEEVADGKVSFHMKPIQFEDLLGRDEISINMELIGQQLGGKVILITGAAGSIGSELTRQLATFRPAMLVLFDMAETPLHQLRLDLSNNFRDLKFVTIIGDVRSTQRLDFIFRKFRPTVVYHAAAYKHVPMMEENPCEAVLDNDMGSKNLADYSVKYGVERFVMISTDKAVNPTNVMGASKRIAEIYIQSLAKKCKKEGLPISFVTTRFGNVLGSNGSVIPYFKSQIEQGGPVTVTHPDIIRYFMTIPEACRLVLEAASFGNSGEIYVFDMGDPVRIADLAKRMIEMAGLEPDKDIKIEYVGLRPGEKLYEELLSNKENTLPTNHDKIMVAKVRDYDFDQVSASFDTMINLAKQVDIMATVGAMKQLVPEYISQNSVFEKLD